MTVILSFLGGASLLGAIWLVTSLRAKRPVDDDSDLQRLEKFC